MTGAFINVAAILLGGMIGILFGARIPERMKETVVAGMGLFTAAMGLQMFLKTQNSLIVLGALVIGTLLGEWLGIENGLHALGQFLEARFARDDAPGASNRFMRGFLTASLLYCIGPLAIVGSINDGLTGDYNLIAVKSVIDCFASIAFASSLGIGVLFSAVPVFMVQGGISFATIQLSHFMTISASATDPKVLELTATGGIILFGLAFGRLLEMKSIRVGNMLPALVVAPLIVWGLSVLT